MNDEDYAYVAAQAEAEGRRRGWNEALDAAWEAVAGLQVYDDHGALEPFSPETAVVYMTAALAAIDTLRKNP